MDAMIEAKRKRMKELLEEHSGKIKKVALSLGKAYDTTQKMIARLGLSEYAELLRIEARRRVLLAKLTIPDTAKPS